MTEKIYAPDMDFGEWKEYTEKALEEPAYRAGQICQWICRSTPTPRRR